MKQGWQTYTLGQVCDIARGGSPRPIKSYLTDDPNGIRWIKIGDTEVGGKYISSTKERIIKEGIKSSRYVKAGDFLLSNSMSFGRPYILKVDGCIHDGWLVIRDYDETFIQDFLYYLLLSPSVAKQFEDGARGSTVRNLNTDIVSAIKVNVPTKKSEQQRIVSLLDAEFAKIDTLKANAERNLQNAKDLFQAALKKELEPKEGWNTKTLGEVCDVQGGSTPLRSEPLFWKNGTYPWFTVDDIREQGRVITDTKQKITKLAWDKLRVFPANSVLLCCTASVGEYAITTIPLTSNQQFNGLTIKKGFDITPMYLFHFASTLKDKLLKLSGKATIDFVSGSKVKSIVISYPSMVEQQSIVARLDALSEKCKTLQANYEKTIALCDDLKQALLRKAFNGEI